MVKPLAYFGLNTPQLRAETADYYNCMNRLDSLIGELLDALRRLIELQGWHAGGVYIPLPFPATLRPMDSFRKIFGDPHDLAPILEDCRARGEVIVFGNGCFDLLHVGHIRYLEAAKALGDVLVIAVNTEASIATNENREPSINPCEERMEVIAAIEAVDYVVPLNAAIPIPLIELYRPHIQAKGTDYDLEKMPERFAVEAGGGRIEFVGDEKTHSSTELRQALRERGEI